jgi:hypothetical protein
MSVRPLLAAALASAVLATACTAGGEETATRTAERTRPATSAPAPSPRTPPEPTPDGVPAVLVAARDGVPPAARTPQQLAYRIRVAEHAIADRRTEPRLLAAAGRLQQLSYRQLGATPRWDAAVRRLLPGALRGVVADNVASRREFRSMHSTLSRTLPAWRIVPPARAATLLGHYREAEATFGVDWEYLAAINLVETGMGRIRGLSVAGARGPMQFIPSTWARWGRGDIDSPRDSILAAGRYLADRGFTRGVRGRDQALYSYNNHPAYVRGVSLLAEVMKRRPRAYLGYYHWEIYYLSAFGDVLLPVGYVQKKPIPVRRYLASR